MHNVDYKKSRLSNKIFKMACVIGGIVWFGCITILFVTGVPISIAAFSMMIPILGGLYLILQKS